MYKRVARGTWFGDDRRKVSTHLPGQEQCTQLGSCIHPINYIATSRIIRRLLFCKMLLRYLFTSVLALGLASAAPAQTRQDPTINVQLKHSASGVTKSLSNVPLTDVTVAFDPPFTADIFNAECDGGCRFQCTLHGPNEEVQVPLGPSETNFKLDATALITGVSCAPVLTHGAEPKRQDEGEGGLAVEFTNSPRAITESIRLDDDGEPRAVNFNYTVSVVSIGCAEVCIPELAYHCQLFDRALQPVERNLTGPGSLTFPQGQQPFISQITCYEDDWEARWRDPQRR